MHRKDLEEAPFQAPVGHLCHRSHLLNIQQNDNTNSKSNQCFFCAGLCCLPRTHPAQHIPTTGPLHLPFPCLTSPSLPHPSGSPLPTSSSSLCQCHLASETTPVHPNCSHPPTLPAPSLLPALLHMPYSVFNVLVCYLFPPLFKCQEG